MDYQPENQTQTTHTYYGEKRSQGMAIAAIVMGIISIATSCCIYAAIVTGALAIIFALLSSINLLGIQALTFFILIKAYSWVLILFVIND